LETQRHISEFQGEDNITMNQFCMACALFARMVRPITAALSCPGERFDVRPGSLIKIENGNGRIFHRRAETSRKEFSVFAGGFDLCRARNLWLVPPVAYRNSICNYE
jgi:hypothetical protein